MTKMLATEATVATAERTSNLTTRFHGSSMPWARAEDATAAVASVMLVAACSLAFII